MDDSKPLLRVSKKLFTLGSIIESKVWQRDRSNSLALTKKS